MYSFIVCTNGPACFQSSDSSSESENGYGPGRQLKFGVPSSFQEPFNPNAVQIGAPSTSLVHTR